MENEEDPSIRIIKLKQRSPSEAEAYMQGFEAGLKAAAEAISKSLESYRTTRSLFATIGSKPIKKDD
jgi:hypothetical protein